MDIFIILKQTFDTEEKVVIENGKIVEENAKFVINPYDEYAVEESIALKDKFGGEVTVITLGPPRAEIALRTVLAMGADKGVIIDPADYSMDEYIISKALSSYLKKMKYDLIIGGNMSVDNGAGQVCQRIAEELGIPSITTITKLEIEGTQVVCERDAEGDVEIVVSSLPLLVTAQQGLNEPRYPSLPGIMKAKKKPIEKLSIGELGLSERELKAKTAVVERYLPPKKQAGHIFKGELQDQAKELIHVLRNEVKVI